MNIKQTFKKIVNVFSKKDISSIIDKKANSSKNLKKLEEIILKKSEKEINKQSYRGIMAVVSILWKSKGEKIITKAKEKISNFIKEEFENNHFSIKSNYVSGSKIKPTSYLFNVMWRYNNEELNFVNFKLNQNNEPDENLIVFLEGYEKFVEEIKKFISLKTLNKNQD